RGERPRLAGDIAHAGDAHAGFLEHFARDRFFHRLAGFDEAGQRREAALREARLAAQQEPAAVRTGMFDEHDRHGIDAREVLRGASRTIALPTALGGLGELAALRAETVARMPVDHRARLAVDCELGSGEARYLRPCRTMRVGGAAVAARRNFGER